MSEWLPRACPRPSNMHAPAVPSPTMAIRTRFLPLVLVAVKGAGQGFRARALLSIVDSADPPHFIPGFVLGTTERG